MDGKVVRLKIAEGFGFVRGVDGQDRFFHKSGVVGGQAAFDQLAIGNQVTFDPEQGDKGPRAANVAKR